MTSSSRLLAALPLALRLARGAIIYVQVGEGGNNFVQPGFPANIGDQVQWLFSAGTNHSVIEGEFANPCMPKPGGFNSGFVPVPADAEQTGNTFVRLTTSPFETAF
jgi:hypothetical protein